jgi:hypothetical protein
MKDAKKFTFLAEKEQIIFGTDVSKAICDLFKIVHLQEVPPLSCGVAMQGRFINLPYNDPGRPLSGSYGHLLNLLSVKFRVIGQICVL